MEIEIISWRFSKKRLSSFKNHPVFQTQLLIFSFFVLSLEHDGKYTNFIFYTRNKIWRVVRIGENFILIIIGISYHQINLFQTELIFTTCLWGKGLHWLYPL